MRCLPQDTGFWATKQLSPFSTSWLRHLFDNLTGVIARWQADFSSQKPANLFPDTRSLGNPCRQKMWNNITSTVFLVERNLGRGMKYAILDNLHTTVNTVVLPSEAGKPVTKSREMSDHGHWGLQSALAGKNTQGANGGKPELGWCDDVCWYRWEAQLLHFGPAGGGGVIFDLCQKAVSYSNLVWSI